jgi:hypothetical protein
MRIGQNPAKFIDTVAQPQKISVALITYLPYLKGYYAEGLEVLKACLDSLRQNTELPYDLMVFDNASCPEVQEYLAEQHGLGRIQFLVCSDKNIGKGGAWNFIFGAAPGEFIVYADSDIYFHPGWLPAQLNLFERVPNLGMVTGAPLRVPEEFSTSTVTWAETQPSVRLVRGKLLPWEDFWKHVRSLGIEEPEARERFAAKEDLCLEVLNPGSEPQRYYIGAAHFQFIARKQVLLGLLPLPSDRPMGQMRALDIAMNEKGYLRLCTPVFWVQHMGNSLGSGQLSAVSNQQTARASRPSKTNAYITRWKPLRRFLMWVYNKTFELLYK